METPNALNALKRLKVLFGKTNLQPYDDYFQSVKWLGHIREYSVGDLTYLANQYNFRSYKIFGLNYYGTLYSKFNYSIWTKLIDHLLRLSPGLCSTVYLKAKK